MARLASLSALERSPKSTVIYPSLSAHHPAIPTQQSFVDKCIPEPNSGCWLWTGVISSKRGYGRFSRNINGQKYAWSSHRLSYFLHCGAAPDDMYVCHRCDNPSCVNPDHLFLGTSAENSADAIRKGRKDPYVLVKSGKATPMFRGGPALIGGDSGRPHPCAKLTADDALYIATSDLSHAALARKFGVHHESIRQVRRGHSWRHITGIENQEVAL